MTKSGNPDMRQMLLTCFAYGNGYAVENSLHTGFAGVFYEHGRIVRCVGRGTTRK
jgi:hypothetical protein